MLSLASWLVRSIPISEAIDLPDNSLVALFSSEKSYIDFSCEIRALLYIDLSPNSSDLLPDNCWSII